MSISVKFESPKFKEKFLICSIKGKKKKKFKWTFWRQTIFNPTFLYFSAIFTTMPCYKLSHDSVAYFSPFLRQTILGLSSSELDLAGLISHVSHFWEKATQSMLFSSRRGKDKRSSHCRQLQNPLLESHLLKHYWPKQGIWPSPALVLELTILTLLTLRAWYAGSLLPRHSPPSFIFSLPYSPSEEKKKKALDICDFTHSLWAHSLGCSACHSPFSS